MKIIFGKAAGFKTATFLKPRYLFLYRHFVLEICLNFYGLVNAAYGDKSFEIGFNFVLILLIEHTESILSIFLGGEINDKVNTISVHYFQIKFPSFYSEFQKTLYFQPIFVSKLFSISPVTNTWDWRWRAAKVFPLQSISHHNLFQSSLQKFQKFSDYSKQIKISWNSIPQKNQYLKNKFSHVTLISFGIWVLTNLSVLQNTYY